jgi:putative ABC transport system permease protein
VPLLLVGIDRSQAAHDVTQEIWLVALGALMIFFGTVVLLATFARPLAGAIGWPARTAGVSGLLARGNAMRNPRRTAATASALVIGLALVGLVGIFGDSAKTSVRAAVDRGIRADLVLKAQQFAGFSPQVAKRVARVPGVDAVASFRFGNVRVNGSEETFAGVNRAGLARTVDLRMRQGSPRDLGADGVLVFRDAARRYHVGVGDTLEVQFPRRFATLRVDGIYAQEDFVGGFPVPFVVGKAVYEAGFGIDDQDSLVYVASADDGQSLQTTVKRELRRDFPNIHVLTRDEYRNEQERAIDRFLAVTLALLFLSEIIAVLGIVNTLALSVFERTHELGLLRSVGMSRRQLRRMIRGESVIVALIGGVVGTVIGVVWGWGFTTALESQGITEVSIPAWELVLFLALSMLAGVVAAVAPAWRASRLDVLAAIATE